MASSSLAKCPCCKKVSFSEFSCFLPHVKKCSLEKFNDKDADHNNQMSQQTKHTVSYECSMCKEPLSNSLMVLQHIAVCAPIYAGHFFVDNPSVSTASDFSDDSNPLVFSYKDEDWAVSSNEGTRRQTITRKLASNTNYFAENEIIGVIGDQVIVTDWDLIWSRHFKKATTNREILDMSGIDFTVTRGKDYTIDKHVRRKFSKVGYTPDAEEVAKVIRCDLDLHNDLVNTSSKQVKSLILLFAAHLMRTDPAYEHVTISKYSDLGSSTDPKGREVGEKAHAFVMDKLRLRSWERAPLLAKLVEFVTSNRNILRKAYPHKDVSTMPAHFVERLTKEGISIVGGNYRRCCRNYHKKWGSTPTEFEFDVHSMIAGSHFPPSDFDNNRDFAIDDLEVINELMNTEIIAGTPLCQKYVHAEVARAAEPQEITPFQRSRLPSYEWWIKNYPGVPYLGHPAMGGVKPSMEEMYGERPTDMSKWPTAKQLYTHS